MTASLRPTASLLRPVPTPAAHKKMACRRPTRSGDSRSAAGEPPRCSADAAAVARCRRSPPLPSLPAGAGGGSASSSEESAADSHEAEMAREAVKAGDAASTEAAATTASAAWLTSGSLLLWAPIALAADDGGLLAVYDPAGGADTLKTVAGVGYIGLVIVYFVRLFSKRAKTATSEVRRRLRSESALAGGGRMPRQQWFCSSSSADTWALNHLHPSLLGCSACLRHLWLPAALPGLKTTTTTTTRKSCVLSSRQRRRRK